MKIKRERLIYDIANLAYVIADTGDYGNHGLHRITDICEDGNRDRVARVLGHAYSHVIDRLASELERPDVHTAHDWSKSIRDYELKFRKDSRLSPQRKIRIVECCREYMVSMVLHDWLSFTFPEGADIWKEKAEEALESLSTALSCNYAFRRLTPPI